MKGGYMLVIEKWKKKKKSQRKASNLTKTDDYPFFLSAGPVESGSVHLLGADPAYYYQGPHQDLESVIYIWDGPICLGGGGVPSRVMISTQGGRSPMFGSHVNR